MKGSWGDGSDGIREGEPPRSSRSQPDFSLEIYHVPTGRRRFQDLVSPRVMIGRSPTADVVLDDSGVSQNHAELVRGPLGQWWIHDLDSETGSFIHGRHFQEKLLTSGDELAIGSYRLRMTKLSSSSVPTPGGFGGAADGEPAQTVRFGSMLPPPEHSATPHPRPGPRSTIAEVPETNRISALHLSRVISLKRTLMQADDAAVRGRLLCEFLASDDFCVDSVAIVNMTGPTTACVVEGPVRKSGTTLPIYLSSRMTARFWETRRAVCYHTKPDGRAPGKKGTSRVVVDCPHLTGQVRDQQGNVLRPTCTCDNGSALHGKERLPTHVVLLFPLRDDAQSVEGLHVAMDSSHWNPEWCAVVALVAEAFQQVELVWQMRSHVRQASSVERELEMARQIQQSLVPQQAHFDTLHQRLEVVVGFEPCHWVGGDYADAVPMPDGRVLLAIADVCGKGMQAALVASSLHTFVRATVDLGQPLPELVSRINRHMCRYLPDHVFITMLCVAADLVTGELEIVSAGHPPGFIGEPSGRVFSLDAGHNVGIGLMDTEIVSGTHTLGPDQMLFLYTDGLTEAVNKQLEPLGMERLARMFSRAVSLHGERGPRAMREAMLSSMRAYRGSLLAHDDTTFLLARLRLGSSSPKKG